MKKFNIYYFILVLLIAGCRGNNTNSESTEISDILSGHEETELSISEETMHEIIQSLPSPLEIATIIKESGFKYDQNLLNDTKNIDLYSIDTEKAMAMGIYAGDLGYINIYEKGYAALGYLTAIKRIADDLKVGHFFDFETIKRIANNSDKLDSLLYISTISFEKMDSYLRDQKRSKLSILIVTGTWIESLYLATQVVSSTGNEELTERIAEQKLTLDQVMLILTAYQADPYFKKVLNYMNELKSEYDQVTINYVYQEPETMEVNGRLVIVDNSYTEVVITAEQVDTIGNLVQNIRENIITNF